MRLKLRIYTRDLDLVALKQHPLVDFNELVRVMLLEYVTTGKCAQIDIPPYDYEVVFRPEVVDVALVSEKYKPVVDWLVSIRDGLRCMAVKAIIRSSITAPQLHCFAAYSNHLIVPEDAKSLNTILRDATKADQQPITEALQRPDLHAPSSITANINAADTEEMVMDVSDFFDNIDNF